MTGYRIYCKKDEKEKLSVSADATATSAVINGLITGEDYYITIVALSNVSSSIETSSLNVTIQEGM